MFTELARECFLQMACDYRGDDAQRADSDRARRATASRQAYQSPVAPVGSSSPAPAMDRVKHHLGSSLSLSHQGHERESQEARQATASRQQFSSPYQANPNAGPPQPARNSRSLYSSSISFG